MTIREFCAAFIKQKGISFSELSKSLGYKSTNSLYRLMDEPVWLSTIKDFRERIKSVWELSEEENAELEQAIVEKLYGTENAGIYKAMEGLLMADDQVRKGEKGNPFQVIVEHYENCSDMHLTIFNSVQADVIEVVHQLMLRGAQVDHYYLQDMDVESRIRRMTLVFPLLFNNAYHGYIPDQQDKPQHQEQGSLSGVIKADIAWCDFKDEAGVRQTDIILFTEKEPLFFEDSRLPRPDSMDNCIPVKKRWAKDSASDDYLAFCQNCADLDLNRRVLCIKPDLCYGMISGEHLGALTERGPLSMITGFQVLQQQLKSIFNKRFENNMTKKRHSWFVMKKSALERFMETGRLTDHLWAMRPFTPQERCEVLTEMLDRSEQSYYVHLLVLKDESVFGDKEIDLYEGKGLLLQSSTTDYNLGGTYSEVMITHPMIMKWFKEYFMNMVVKHMCLTEGESMAFLRGLAQR